MKQNNSSISIINNNNSKKSNFITRRNFLRVKLHKEKIKIEIAMSELFSTKVIISSGDVLNISRGGMLTRFKKPLAVFKKINFKILLPNVNKEIHGTGRIIWEKKEENNLYYGIRFNIKNIEGNIELLKKVIDENKFKAEERRKKVRRNQRLKKKIDKRKIERRIDKNIFLKCIQSFYNRSLNVIKNRQYLYLREISSGSENIIYRNGKRYINFASNNYLGFTTHPEVKEAAIKAMEKYGVGSGSVRILSGTMDLHNMLEKELAKFKGGDACLVYPSGYSTNVGVVSCLANKKDILIVDEKSHASIFDGCILSGAKMLIFKHNDTRNLENILKKAGKNSAKLIITDGVFSMDGDIAPLDKIYLLGQNYNAAIMIDDAHSTGVLGKTGKGTTEHFGLDGKIDLTIGTLSKALGGIGGFAVGNKNIIHYLKHNSRSFVFSTSLPPSICAALLKVLEILNNEPQYHLRLWRNINYAKKELINLGFNVGNSKSAIIPIIIGDENMTFKAAYFLEREKIFVNPVIFPAVKLKESRLRVSIMSTHTDENLNFLVTKLKKIGKELNII